MDPCPAGLSVPSPEQGLGLRLGCTATAFLLSRLPAGPRENRAARLSAGRSLAELPGPGGKRRPFGGAPGSPAFHPAETRRGPGFAPSFPWSQEALKGTQATSPGLATSTSAHCRRLGPAGTNLPDFCLSSAPPVPLWLRSTTAAGVPPQSSMALRKQFLPLTNACRARPTSPGGALLPSGLKSAPFCHSGLGSKSCPPREMRLLTVPSGAGAPSQHSAKVTKTQKIKTSCLPARLQAARGQRTGSSYALLSHAWCWLAEGPLWPAWLWAHTVLGPSSAVQVLTSQSNPRRRLGRGRASAGCCPLAAYALPSGTPPVVTNCLLVFLSVGCVLPALAPAYPSIWEIVPHL